MKNDYELEAFLALYLAPAEEQATPARPSRRITVTRRPQRTRDALSRLLDAGAHYFRLAQEDAKRETL